ncbi:type II toxin-antitoxin system prevent-host-death family antitoxin [Streptomyces sp. NPDC048442]|uniref:type II toxin-antitoxin system Phd/YefM family antitoxin n=1 Tax=Streptomyces sp. NPDC048442 TaxID=3154823 RepID=UPI003414BE06
MEATAREFNQRSSQILAAAEHGETVTVTKNGRPVARLVPIDADEALPYSTDPMGDMEIPDIGTGPDLTDEEVDEVLRGMGS